MYSLYRDFSDQKISLAYFGVFSDKITNLLIDLSESYVSKTEHLSKLSKKASFLIAESFQNIIKHGIIEKDNVSEIQYSKDFFQISILEDRVVISSANVIKNENVETLNKNIELINSLSSEELKNLKQKILQNGIMTEKGGASLGLIEMVRKSGLPLQKHFIPIKENFSLVILVLEIPVSNKTIENKIEIKTIEQLYFKLVDDDILMLYKGDFSSEANSSLIEMLNNNFLKNNQIDPSKVKNIVTIIEVMQNASKHGKSIEGYKEGIFTLSIINNELFIECCNFVKHENYEDLKNMLKSIKESSLDEIDKMYKMKLANSYLSDDDNGGLGILEIARFTKNTFIYSFVETPDNEIFYSIKIKTV